MVNEKPTTSHGEPGPKLLAGGNPQIAKGDGDGDEIDADQFTSWVNQAAALPDWGTN